MLSNIIISYNYILSFKQKIATGFYKIEPNLKYFVQFLRFTCNILYNYPNSSFDVINPDNLWDEFLNL